jgi:hypothetical protein
MLLKILKNKKTYRTGIWQSQKHDTLGINYFADLRMTFRQNFFLQDWFRNKFVVGLG